MQSKLSALRLCNATITAPDEKAEQNLTKDKCNSEHRVHGTRHRGCITVSGRKLTEQTAKNAQDAGLLKSTTHAKFKCGDDE